MLRNQRLITVPLNQQELSGRNRPLAVLLQLSNFLSTCTELEPLLEGALDLVLEQFGLKAGRVYLGEAGGEYFQMIIHRSLNPRGLEMVDANTGFTGKAARTRSFLAMRVADLDDEARTQMLSEKGFEQVICIPLITRDQVIGVMNLAAEEVIPLELATIDLSMVMANLVATATESVLQARELTDQARVLAEQKEAVQFFAYTACHDMKSPATGVHGLARMLAQRAGDKLDEKGRAIIGQIERAAQRIEDLASEVNAYIRAKEAPIKPEELELGEVLGGIAGELSSRAEALGVELVYPTGQIRLKADRAALTRALTNLVDNALKYGGPKLKKIEVTYQFEKGHHVFKVMDDGVGVPPDLAEKCFTLFKRAETSQGTEGTGLGLAIVRTIAYRHGGRAWLDTGRPRGACFCFSMAEEPPEEEAGC
ncbi:MAG: GAF domain-containing protein [Desulfarculaceae bacterium]|nr:GAF domain-containing protein [Desulfarculaceae bacterium]